MSRNVLVVAKYTFLEIVKSRIVLVSSLIGFFLMLVSYVISEFSYGAQIKVLIDTGLGFSSICLVLISIFFGSTLINKEIENRTIYIVLSKSISRKGYYLGKILGLFGILLSISLVINIMICTSVKLYGKELPSLFIHNFSMTLIESFIVLLFVLMVSLRSNMVISIAATSVMYITGHAIAEAKNLSFVLNSVYLKKMINIYPYVLPDLSKLNLKKYLLYEKFLPDTYLVSAYLYGIMFCCIFIAIGALLFERKELE